MGRLYKRGATYWGDWRDAHGERHRGSLSTRDREVARQRLRDRELAVPADSAAHGSTLTAALTHLVAVVYAGRPEGTVSCYRHKARHLVRLLGEHHVGELERAHVMQYRASRIGEGAAESTIAKELVVLRLALREQGIDGVVPRIKVRYVPRRRYLAYDDALSLLEELAQRRRIWVLLAVYAGPRAAELEQLTWEDVDLVGGWIRWRGSKTEGSDRPTPIAAALRPWLEAWADGADPGRVLDAWANHRRDLARACERAGLRVGTARIGVRVPRVSPNDLRRTFASWLVQDGVSNRIVAWLLGHRTTRMVDLVYGQSAPETLTAAVARLPGCDAGVTSDRDQVGRIRAVETAPESVSAQDLVPRVGIEPTTRGFSGPGHRRLTLVRP
jgi:integrase